MTDLVQKIVNDIFSILTQWKTRKLSLWDRSKGIEGGGDERGRGEGGGREVERENGEEEEKVEKEEVPKQDDEREDKFH